jgi:hypothetical protein
MKYHIDLPYIDDNGLVAIPSSLGLDRDPYGWSSNFHIQMIRKYIDVAAKNKKVCHFWFHPSMNPWYLENIMPIIIKIVREYRDSGKISVHTMESITEVFVNLHCC